MFFLEKPNILVTVIPRPTKYTVAVKILLKTHFLPQVTSGASVSRREKLGGLDVKTPLIIGATVVGTVAVFSMGGLVAISFMKQLMPAAPQVAAAPAAIVVPEPAKPETPMVAAIEAPVEQPVLAPVAEAPVVVAAAAEPEAAVEELSTDQIIANLLAQKDEAPEEKEVVIYDFVSASQSEEQFDTAIPERLTNAVQNALNSGRSVSELDGMVRSAIELGLVDAPAALSLPDGTPDARAILLSIVNDHETETGKTFEKSFLGVDETLQNTGRNQTYVVESGDSLAYLALKFYGDTSEYRVIFNANRSKIGTPDKIQVGQRLIIPAL